MSFPLGNTVAELKFERDFTCWRGREFDEFYQCSVTGIDGGAVRIELDSMGFEISADVAEAIAFSLSEAATVVKNTDIEAMTGARREECLLPRKYRLAHGRWLFSATGVVHVSNASDGLLDEGSCGDTRVTVRTIEEGGFELEFEWMGYSFSPVDAAWLHEKLLEASQQDSVSYPRARLLETGCPILNLRRA
ncbi:MULTISPECIES: hypothetical protein [Pseudomonas fluorescens group]|uniref:Uncharacterized protein n=1 Tax=Pseudomonas rustica TaxID=2827099 RepID=A0ABS5MR98_9PSED|nr:MULTISPECIES: hypothetical protein [Pseudomonas fluorescens group]MBS4076784.1 hypothetical protein [Pseudomonas rustica]CEL30576.1 hypothetical protein SRM1_03935 [Pseudomonas fluorescens]